MIDSRTLAGLPPVMLFLKATVKKQIFVPSHTRHDGSFVAGHYKWVHVSDDHDEHKVLAGQGSHSQKIAHAKLSKLDSFNQLPHDHKVAVVLAHATDHQNMDSANARVSTLVKKILSGEKPTPSEWKAWGYVDNDKREKAFSAVAEAGKGAFFQNSMDTAAVNEGHKARTDAVSPAADAPPAAEKPVPVKEPAKVEPEPEKVPAKAVPEPGADHTKVKMLLGAAGLPSENVNAKHFNAKLASIKHAFEAGDIKALLCASYGTNTYGKKAAKLANEVLAVLGSKETVQPGQKAGTHAAAAGDKAVPSAPAPAPKVVAATATEKPAAADMGNPITQQNQQNQPARPPKVVGAAAAVNPVSANSPEKPKAPHIVGSLAAKDIVQKITDEMGNGDAKTIEFVLMNLPKSTKLKWDKVKQYGEQAIAYVNAQKGKTAGADANPAAGAPTAEHVATLSENELQDIFNAADAPASMTMDQVKASAKAGDINGVQAVLNALPPNGWPKTKVAIKNIIALMKEKQTKTTFTMSTGTPVVGLAGKSAVKHLQNIKNDGGDLIGAAQDWITDNPGAWDEINQALKKVGMPEQATYGPNSAGFDSGPKEGDTKIENGKTYALKDGRWHLVGGDKPAGHVVLEESELPLKPPGASSKYYNDAQKFALAGNMAELKKLHTALLNDGYASTHPVVMQMIDQLSAKQAGTGMPPAAPVAPSIVGLNPTATSAMIDAEHAFVVAPNLAKLKELKQSVDGLHGFEKVNDYIDSAIAYMEHKGGSAPAIGLSPDEIPKPLKGTTNAAYVKKAAQLAAAGDIDGLAKLAKEVAGHAAPMPGTMSHILKVKSALETKQSGSVKPASAALSPDEIHAYTSKVDSASADAAKELAVAGDMAGLQAHIDTLVDMDYQHTAAYAKELYAKMHTKSKGGAIDAGPKEGDTKPGADGMLVFQNGRWHKMEQDDGKTPVSAAVMAMVIKGIKKPKFAGDKMKSFNGMFKELQPLLMQYGPGFIDQQTKELSGKKTLEFGTWKWNMALTGPNSTLFKQYLEDVKQVAGHMKIKGGAPASLGAGAVPPKPAPAPKDAAPSYVSNTTQKVGEINALVADKWVQTGPQKGSNEGGKFKDGSGQEWYCKFPGDDNVVKNELLAAKFYEMLGAKVPSLRLVKKDGKLGIASKWVDGIKTGSAADLAKAPGAHSAFVFDAWLANWDVVGLNNDNLMLDKEGKALRVDVGGSLVYRAMGGEKGAAFGDTVTELDTLIDAAKNDKSAAVFKGISDADLQAGGAQLAKMQNKQIEKMVDLFGPGTAAQRAALVAKLEARRADILKKLNIEDPWNKPPPDKTKLPVRGHDLPAAIDFSNYPGKNGPLSSKEHINKQNTIDDAALIAFAQKGNLIALKDYQYDAYDKETGALLGKKPIISHPSKDIKEHWAYLCQLLESIASPSIMGLEMPPLGSGSIDEIAEAAGFHAIAERPDTIPADKRLGFWMKLAHAGDDFMDLVPKKQSFMSTAAKTAAKSLWNKISSITKAYISEVQGSGWINHVFSDGSKTVNASGNGGSYSGGLAGLAAAAYKDAIEQPEGTTLSRWMKMSDAMKSQLLKEKPGLIFQNTDSMCTSMRADWENAGGFGNAAFLEIVYAKGARAVHSHASGSFKSEEEITTLPGARFMLIEAKKGNAKGSDGIRLKLLMLPPHEGFVEDMKNQAKIGK